MSQVYHLFLEDKKFSQYNHKMMQNLGDARWNDCTIRKIQ